MASFKLGFQRAFIKNPLNRTDGTFLSNARFFGSGRAAITHAVQTSAPAGKKIKLLVPTLICYELIDFMTEALPNVEISFYELDKDLLPNLDSIQKLNDLTTTDIILMIDYFGSAGYSTLKAIAKNIPQTVIFDCVHSFFPSQQLIELEPNHHVVIGFRKIFFPLVGSILYSGGNSRGSILPKKITHYTTKKSIRTWLWSLSYGKVMTKLLIRFLNWDRLIEAVKIESNKHDIEVEFVCPVRFVRQDSFDACHNTWPTFPKLLQGELLEKAKLVRANWQIISKKT